MKNAIIEEPVDPADKKYESFRSLLSKSIQQIQAARDQKFSGVPSGFMRIDAITGGWQKGDLIIVAARPGMGKTAFVLSIARNAAVDFNKPVVFFNLDTTTHHLVTRILSVETEIYADKLRKGDISEDEFHRLNVNFDKISDAPIFIDDTALLSIQEFRERAVHLKSEHNISMIIIDDLQLMLSDQEDKINTEKETSAIAYSLKSIAKELDIPIIVVSQVSRSAEDKSDGINRPRLRDIRTSRAIVRNADLILFIYRPEYYFIMQDEEGNSLKGIAEIIVSKNRNGRTGSENLIFIKEYAKFVEPTL